MKKLSEFTAIGRYRRSRKRLYFEFECTSVGDAAIGICDEASCCGEPNEPFEVFGVFKGFIRGDSDGDDEGQNPVPTGNTPQAHQDFTVLYDDFSAAHVRATTVEAACANTEVQGKEVVGAVCGHAENLFNAEEQSAFEKRTKKPYTVVAIYRENNQRYSTGATCSTIEEAAANAIHSANVDNRGIEPISIFFCRSTPSKRSAEGARLGGRCSGSVNKCF